MVIGYWLSVPGGRRLRQAAWHGGKTNCFSNSLSFYKLTHKRNRYYIYLKTQGMDDHVLLPAPVYGPNAQVVAGSLAKIDIPCKILADEDKLVFELVWILNSMLLF